MVKYRVNKYRVGVLLLGVSILLVLFFFIRGYEDFYWRHPLIFVPHTVVIVGACFYGAYLVMSPPGKYQGILWRRLVFLAGWIIFVGGVFCGLSALFLAFSISFDSSSYYMGHFHVNTHGSFEGTIVFGIQMFTLWCSVFLGAIGSLIIKVADLK